MSDPEPLYRGACYCGAVEVEARGAPRTSAYCHCRSCRDWLGAPINAWMIWRSDKVSITGDVTRSHKNPSSERVACAACGGAVANVKPQIGMTVLFATTLAEASPPFAPTLHIYYDERVMDVADGLPKFSTMPKGFGGDDARVAEPERTGWRA